jgi:membrane-bound metal-dependent hydrolase YbcI (DUF457 family)
MLADGHRATATVGWLAAGTASGMPWWQLTAGAAVAATFAAGKWSPDLDHSGWTARLVPGGHRGVTHFPGTTLALSLAALSLVPPTAAWVAWAVTAGWGSHLIADWVFGRIPVWPRGRGRWRWSGLRLTTGGLAEVWVTRVLWLAALGEAVNLVIVRT